MTDTTTPTGRLSADDLAEVDIETEVVQLPRGTVLVRGVTRAQYLFAGKKMDPNNPDLPAFESALLQAGMVEPKMTAAQIERWQQRARAGDVAKVVNAIRRLSGDAEGADKSDL